MTNTVAKGGVGIAAPVASFFFSQLGSVEIGLRILGLALAALVSLAMLVSILSSLADKRRLRRVTLQAAERDLCGFCRAGHTPLSCPIPVPERPRECPLRDHRTTDL